MRYLRYFCIFPEYWKSYWSMTVLSTWAVFRFLFCKDSFEIGCSSWGQSPHLHPTPHHVSHSSFPYTPSLHPLPSFLYSRGKAVNWEAATHSALWKERQGNTGNHKGEHRKETDKCERENGERNREVPIPWMAGGEFADLWKAPSQKGQSRHEGQKRDLKILKSWHRLKEISAKTTNTKVGGGVHALCAWRCTFFPASPPSFSSGEDWCSEAFTTYATTYVSMSLMPYGSLQSHSVGVSTAWRGFFKSE